MKRCRLEEPAEVLVLGSTCSLPPSWVDPYHSRNSQTTRTGDETCQKQEIDNSLRLSVFCSWSDLSSLLTGGYFILTLKSIKIKAGDIAQSTKNLVYKLNGLNSMPKPC